MRRKQSILEELCLNKKTEVLTKVYENREIAFGDLKKVVSNPNYLKKIIDALESSNVISAKKIGNHKLLSPNVTDNIDVYVLVELLRKARFMEMHRDTVAPYLNELVRKLGDSAFIIVYGSYAMGVQTPQSDIDLCVAAHKKNAEIKKTVSEVFSSSSTRVQLLVETLDEFCNSNDRLHESIKNLPETRIVLGGMHSFLSAI